MTSILLQCHWRATTSAAATSDSPSTLRRGDDETRNAGVGFAMKESGPVNSEQTDNDSPALRHERDVPDRVQVGDPAAHIRRWRVIEKFGE